TPVTTTTTTQSPTVSPTSITSTTTRTTTTTPVVAPTTVRPSGTAFTGFENVVPLGTIALVLMTGGSGLLWAGSRRRREWRDGDEDARPRGGREIAKGPGSDPGPFVIGSRSAVEDHGDPDAVVLTNDPDGRVVVHLSQDVLPVVGARHESVLQ